jgi:hypothetical protein
MAEGRARTVVVGAGIAGLSCARALTDAGHRVTVLERAHGVGGRAATRRVEGQPIDFGSPFLHGRDPAFLALLDAVPATQVLGWPSVIRGSGRPCQLEAFAPGARRLAFAEGISAFPKHLARGLDVRTGVRVISFTLEARCLRLDLEDGRSCRAGATVLALAAEQALALLGATPSAAPALDTARALLGMVRSQPCGTVLAGYRPEGESFAPSAPAWDVHYPEESRILQLIAHDSSKRPAPSFLAMVYQAHPRWSREHLGDDDWPAAMLAEAGRILGPWAASPTFTQAHAWRQARTDLGAELSAPLLCTLPGGARLGLAGELFAPGGGIEAAWVSGQRLARRILDEENR